MTGYPAKLFDATRFCISGKGKIIGRISGKIICRISGNGIFGQIIIRCYPMLHSPYPATAKLLTGYPADDMGYLAKSLIDATLFRARGELTKLMRKNETLEEEVEGMDKKIGLLVQNRISVQDVIMDKKKGIHLTLGRGRTGSGSG